GDRENRPGALDPRGADRPTPVSVAPEEADARRRRERRITVLDDGIVRRKPRRRQDQSVQRDGRRDHGDPRHETAAGAGASAPARTRGSTACSSTSASALPATSAAVASTVAAMTTY